MLQGLAICGVCGRRMTVRYHARQGGLVLNMSVTKRVHIQHGEPQCQHMPGQSIDAAIAELILSHDDTC